MTIFQIYYSIAHLIPNCFLQARNQSAFDHVRSRSIPILRRFLGDDDRFHSIYSILPTPFFSNQSFAKHLYPWTVHDYQYNIRRKSLWWPQYSLVDLIHLSLTGLKASELTLVNAEYMGTQVMLQNIDEIIKSKVALAQVGKILRRKEVNIH